MSLRRPQQLARQTADAAVRFLASERCFYVVLGIFLVQALWFTFTARYPMAFDENFHFGLIRLHAQQWLPFFTSQPPQADIYGAAVRDPSYFYHYLMSWPYRLASLVTANQTAQIIFLRLVNVALFTWSIALTRRLLVRLGGSRALNHVVLFLFCLVPIVPFLAAHINYDNLFYLLFIGLSLGVFNWMDQAKHRTISFGLTALILSGLLLASIVKYTFLPVAFALGLAMLLTLWRERIAPAELWKSVRRSASGLHWLKLTTLMTVLIVSTALFAERYAVNIIRYHSPSPDCAQVLTVERCKQFGPWARDYQFVQTGYVANKLDYPWQWLYGMWQRSFFAISDTYDTKHPLPLPGGTAIALACVSAILFAWYGKRILCKHPYRQVILLMLFLYSAALFLQTYQSFVKTGIPVAINGRYLVPFMPLIFLFAGLGFHYLWERQPVRKVIAVSLVALLFMQGGGVQTFIIRSDDSWDWPNDAIIRINHTTRDILRAFVIGAKD